MGLIQHDCVIAELISENDEFEKDFDKWLESVPERYLPLFIKGRNSYDDLFIIMIPDGSKEYWNVSRTCDEIRNQFIKFLQMCNNQYLARYIHVRFGELPSSITQSSRD